MKHFANEKLSNAFDLIGYGPDASTLQAMQWWLFERKGFWVNVIQDFSFSESWCFTYSVNQRDKTVYTSFHRRESPDMALIDGLLKAAEFVALQEKMTVGECQKLYDELKLPISLHTNETTLLCQVIRKLQEKINNAK